MTTIAQDTSQAVAQLGGWIADRTGGFTPAFLVAAGAALGSASAAATLPRRGAAAPSRTTERAAS